MSSRSVQRFYDQLASEYHLIFADWRDTVRWQGKKLDEIIRKESNNKINTVLDCSCGIGTQAIGLSLLGYEVYGTDASSTAIERAKEEAKSFGVIASFGVAGLLELDKKVCDSFDIVISCDNSLPHLLTDNELLIAARNIRNVLKQGGFFIASIRDYDNVLKDKPKSTNPRVFDDVYGKRIVFQIWEWLEDERNYLLNLFILKDKQDNWSVSQYTTQYRTLLRSELTYALDLAGFSDIHWLMPSESGYYQPIVIAYR